MKARAAGRRLLLAALLAISLPAAGGDPADCRDVRIGTVGWLDGGAAVSLASALLRGLGYEPVVQRFDDAVIFASMKNGDLDAFLEILVPTMGLTLRPYVLDDSVELLRRNLAGTKYTLAVNSAGRDLGIARFDDISRHGESLSHEIHGLEPGADGNLLIRAMIDENMFSLAGFTLVETSEAQLVESIAAANREGRAMVFLGFEPHPMNVRFELTYLAGGDEVFGPGFGGADVYTGVRSPLLAECPNVARLLGNIEFTLPMINEVMTAILELKAAPLVAAVAWIRQQPGVLDPWLQGVETLDGEPGLPAVRRFIGMQDGG